MRLIDADELDRVIMELNTEHGYKITVGEYKLISNVLFEFPTIEPQERIYYEVRNTRNEHGDEAVTAKCDTLEKAKEVLSTHADWYRELGTGRIYKIIQKMRFTKVKQTLVYRKL